MKNYKKVASIFLICMSIFNGKTLALTKIGSQKNHLSKIQKYGILGVAGTVVIAGIVITTVCCIKNKKGAKANNIDILLEKFSKAQGMNDDIWNKIKDKLKNILQNINNGEYGTFEDFKQDCDPILKLLKGEKKLEDCRVSNNGSNLAFKVAGQYYDLTIEKNDGFVICLNGKNLFFSN